MQVKPRFSQNALPKRHQTCSRNRSEICKNKANKGPEEAQALQKIVERAHEQPKQAKGTYKAKETKEAPKRAPKETRRPPKRYQE